MADIAARRIDEEGIGEKISYSSDAGQGMPASRVLESLRELSDRIQLMTGRDRKQATERLRCEIFGWDHRALPFPIKLHRLASCDALTTDICWVEQGKAVAVDRRGYQKRIMRTFFDQNRFKSFQNLIKRYGFQTIHSAYDSSRGEDIIVYSHVFFLRGEEELAKRIVLSSHQASPGLVNHPQQILDSSKPKDERVETSTITSLESTDDMTEYPLLDYDSVESWGISQEADEDCLSVASISVSSVGLEILLSKISAESELCCH